MILIYTLLTVTRNRSIKVSVGNFSMQHHGAVETKNPLPDSRAANPAASRTLTRLIATGVIKSGDKPYSWFKHPQHARAFAPIHTEKFRKRFRKLISKKYGLTLKKVTCLFMFEPI